MQDKRKIVRGGLHLLLAQARDSGAFKLQWLCYSNNTLATLKHTFTKAVEWDMVEEAVWKRIRKVKLLPENNRRLRYLSREECQRLVSVCNSYMKH